MDREKAKQVLEEILVSWNCKEKAPIQGYLLDGSESTDDYVLRLILPAVKDCVDYIKPIIEKHGLAMKQAQGYVIIYTP